MKPKRIQVTLKVTVSTDDDTPVDAVLEMLSEQEPAIKRDANGDWWLGIKMPNVHLERPTLKELGTPN